MFLLPLPGERASFTGSPLPATSSFLFLFFPLPVAFRPFRSFPFCRVSSPRFLLSSQPLHPCPLLFFPPPPLFSPAPILIPPSATEPYGRARPGPARLSASFKFTACGSVCHRGGTADTAAAEGQAGKKRRDGEKRHEILDSTLNGKQKTNKILRQRVTEGGVTRWKQVVV